MKTIPELLDELSFLARETNGGSFVIHHGKEDGKWKVVFNNCVVAIKHDERLKATDFESAIRNGIDWIRAKRKPIEAPAEKYTMY